MNEETLHRMKQMKFLGMVHAFKATMETDQMATLTADQLVSLLIDAEWDDRNLDKNQVMRLAECEFIDKAENILITGSTGVGKSYIASALGNQACTMGYHHWGANGS